MASVASASTRPFVDRHTYIKKICAFAEAGFRQFVSHCHVFTDDLKGLGQLEVMFNP